ncbi:MAG: hypothetical protein Q8O03_04425 [Nanoarchaeota archaeon]|nr:hypothetical protein [Nanoarchaeota archaeon]
MKKLLLTISLLVLLFSFTSHASEYTWVELPNPGGDTLWYDPTTIEIDEGVGSVLLKSYNASRKEHLMFWFIVDCEAKKCYITGALLVDENDKAISPPSDVVLEGIIKSDSTLYNLLCTRFIKDEI